MKIYLASPYSHVNVAVRNRRFSQACRKAAELMQEGLCVYSPIAHSHSIVTEGSLPDSLTLDFDFWMFQDLPFLLACDLLMIIRLDGWQLSKGVHRERDFAREHGIPETFCPPPKPR